MRLSDNGIFALLNAEADVLSTYRDSRGIPTIYVGHTAAAGAPLPAIGLTGSLDESLRVLRQDLTKFEGYVSSALKRPVTQNQFDACVILCFNIGAPGFQKSTVVKRINAGDIQGAADAFMRWIKPSVLVGRRRKEIAIFMRSDYGDISHVPVYDKYPGHPKMVSTMGLVVPDAAGSSPATVPPLVVPAPLPPVTSIPKPAKRRWSLFGWIKSLFH